MAESISIQNSNASALRFNGQIQATPEALRPESEKVNDVPTTEAVPSLEHAEIDHSTDVFSHNRYQALQAYKSPEHTSSVATANDEKRSAEETGEGTDNVKPADGEDEKAKKDDPDTPKGTDGKPLDEDEVEELDSMKKRDQEVRHHENQHKAAGGQYASSPVYEYEKGPDGNSYVTDGHVNIDISKEDTPEKTIEKMRVVHASATAPAELSPEDRSVAAEAKRIEAEARAELAEENSTAGKTSDGKGDQAGTTEDGGTIAAENRFAQGDRDNAVAELTGGTTSRLSS